MGIGLILFSLAAGIFGGLVVLFFNRAYVRVKKMLGKDYNTYIELEEWAGSRVYSCSELLEDNTCSLGYEGCLKCPVFKHKLLQTSSKFRNYNLP
jgi:hypothetical protein